VEIRRRTRKQKEEKVKKEAGMERGREDLFLFICFEAGSHYVVQSGLILSCSTSLVLGLQACSTMPG
jgi:hypothetical protein